MHAVLPHTAHRRLSQRRIRLGAPASGKFAANAAWLALTGIASNLGRWCAAPTSGDWATTATLRRKLFAIPARLVHTARQLHLRLPANRPWQQGLRDLRTAIAGVARAPT